MTPAALLVVLVALALAAYWLGRSRALAVVGALAACAISTFPSYYGALTALWCALPALVVLGTWVAFQDSIIIGLVKDHMPAATRALSSSELSLVMNDVRNVVAGAVPMDAARPESARRGPGIHAAAPYQPARAHGTRLRRRHPRDADRAARIAPALRARNSVERIIEWLLIGCSLIAVLTTIGIIASVVFEAARFFGKVPWYEFLFGLQWSPQTAIRADQVGSSGAFGAVPLFWGTAMISGIAMLIAVPIGLFAAVYLAEYAHPKFRAWTKPFLEILAGIPTVVYGFFAALTVGPALRVFGESIGLPVASESALAAGLVMGIMIVPFVSSLADDMITAVPQSLRDGAYALGATKSETIRQVVFRAALPGIVGGVLLAISRAIGETMIVVMAAGLAANLTANPLEAVTTVTVQIVTLLVGDQEFDSPKTLAAFALGLVLFLVTLGLNILALHIVRKYREQYE